MIQVTRSAPSRQWVSQYRVNLLLLYVPFVVSVALTFCTTTDDPFITLRYAANIVHGHGPVFNAGQPPVEGFSSPLDLIVVVIAYLIPGGHSLLMIKLASLLFGILTLGATRNLIRRTDLPTWGMSLAFFLTGASWTLAFASSNGLETTLAAWLTTMLVARLFSEDMITRPVLVGVIAAGVVLARPEGIGIVVVLALASVVVRSHHVPLWRRVSWSFGGLLAFVAVSLIRILYFGQLLPNTYYAKHVSLIVAIKSGPPYLRNFLLLNLDSFNLPSVLTIGIDVLGIFSTVVLAVGMAVAVLRLSRLFFAIVTVLAQMAFIVCVGGDWMTGGRFFATVAPLLALFEAVGVVALVRLIERRWFEKWKTSRLARGMLVAVTCLAAATPIVSVRNPIWNSHGKFDTASLFAASDGGGFSLPVWLAGAKVLQRADPGDVVAYSEVGYAGFTHLNLRFIDTRGLTDRDIARNAPASDRRYFGVVDQTWVSTTSTVGAEILAQHADLVLTFDPTASYARVLGGRYTQVSSKYFTSGSIRLFLYRRVGETSRAPGFKPLRISQ